MRQTISDEIAGGGYDLVHAEPFYVTPSIPEIPIPLVVAEHNVEYQVYQDYADTSKFPLLKYLLNQETERIKMAEYSALNYAGHVIAVSPEDKSAFCKITGKENISIIPNGVDIEYFRYQERGKQTDPVFLFVGSFKWLPNREVLKRLINDIWPEVRLKIPRATLRVVGRDIPAGIKSGSYPGVVFADNVTDIRIEYAKAAALISPVQIPGGSKYKILESMAAGLPVVTTVAGLSGINAQNRIHALTVESDREFPGALVKLLQSPEECRKMTKNARDLIEADYSWIKIAQKLEKVWQQIIK
jgi:glycosyltransferase involved in cell wall biosynthesis